MKVKAAILNDADKALRKEGNIVEWIAECNGNLAACQDARKAIQAAKDASPLDCLGRVQSQEAASAAYSLYQQKALDLPKCITERC